MITLTTIEALEAAIAMLENIECGGTYSALDFSLRLLKLKDARDEHHRQVMKDERARQDLREANARLRSARRA